MGKLTAAKVKGTSKPGWYGDGSTLYLVVAPGGSKSWFQRLAIKGKVQGVGLGGYPAVSLAEAREKAFENRRHARAGGDPLEAKREAERQAKIPTFRQAAEQTRDVLRPGWRGERTESIWMGALVHHAFPAIGRKPVNVVTRTDVAEILVPLLSSEPAMARKVRTAMRATFGWCQGREYIDLNPAGEVVDGVLPRVPTVKAHHPFLHYSEVTEALRKADQSGHCIAAKLCLRLLVLSGVRRGNAARAKWADIDMEAREWRIPAEGMKSDRPHVVPLSTAALAVLEQARMLHDGSGHVFPSPKKPGRPIDDKLVYNLLVAIGLKGIGTPHGFRSTFRTWGAKRTSATPDILEMCLAHKVGSLVERSYQRGDMRDKRRPVMEKWGAYVTGESAKVVSIGAGR